MTTEIPQGGAANLGPWSPSGAGIPTAAADFIRVIETDNFLP